MLENFMKSFSLQSRSGAEAVSGAAWYQGDFVLATGNANATTGTRSGSPGATATGAASVGGVGIVPLLVAAGIIGVALLWKR